MGNHEPSTPIPNDELLRDALMALAVVVGTRRPFFVAIGGDGPDQGIITGGTTSVEDQVTMLRAVLASFEANTARVALSERVELETGE